MGKLIKINPVARAIGVFAAVAALVGGVTFAALSSTATLTANTLTSATASLLVDGSDGDVIPTASEAGFAFDALAPGEESDPETFLLRNAGDVDLDVTVYATNSVVTGLVNNDKIHFCFTKTGGTGEVCFTRTEMLANFNNLPDNPLLAADPDVDVAYTVVVKVDADHPGSGFSVAPFDLVFTGTQVAEVPEP